MKYEKLGNSGIEVSKLCVGCIKDFHEWTLDPDETEEVVRHILDLGINFFDTANTYAHGTSEEYLGRAVRNNVSRDEVVLASKVYFNDGHLSKEAINREIDGTPIEETMEALHKLVKAGKVRALGASAMYGYSIICSLRQGITDLLRSYRCKTITI